MKKGHRIVLDPIVELQLESESYYEDYEDYEPWEYGVETDREGWYDAHGFLRHSRLTTEPHPSVKLGHLFLVERERRPAIERVFDERDPKFPTITRVPTR